MEKIKLHYLLGDVHMGGHDVHRIAKSAIALLNEAGCFEILLVCDFNLKIEKSERITFDEYFKSGRINNAQTIVFHCGNWRFNIPEEQKMLEHAVSAGCGFILMHGEHPCYWTNVGMAEWAEFEKLAIFTWREKTSHGDFGDFHISVKAPDHPLMRGLADFNTRDEIFCNMENRYSVPYTVLASAYSDSTVISRHGQAGTGQDEPIAVIGTYGKGRIFNHGLGHVWPYYTGHGLGENTLVSWMPKEFRILFVRSCEWTASGKVVYTNDFSGGYENVTR
jgi:type 1 glutamine amidotransferase